MTSLAGLAVVLPFRLGILSSDQPLPDNVLDNYRRSSGFHQAYNRPIDTGFML